MNRTAYEQAIKQSGKFILMSENNGNVNEVLKVFDTEDEAFEYASGRMKWTKNNKIDMYTTTGNPNRVIDGYTYRDNIKPYKQVHIGLNW